MHTNCFGEGGYILANIDKDEHMTCYNKSPCIVAKKNMFYKVDRWHPPC